MCISIPALEIVGVNPRFSTSFERTDSRPGGQLIKERAIKLTAM